MASRPWNDSDVAFLKTLADRRDWFDSARLHFNDRTDGAVRQMMWKVREGLGIVPTRGRPSTDWMVDAARGARQLLEALERTGLRP